MFSNSLNRFIHEIFGLIKNHIVGWRIFELFAAEATLKLGDAVKTVFGFIKPNDSPEVIAFDAALSGFTHGGHMEKRCSGILGAKIRGSAVVI